MKKLPPKLLPDKTRWNYEKNLTQKELTEGAGIALLAFIIVIILFWVGLWLIA